MTAGALPALAPARIDEAVSAERRRLADFVDVLTDEQWAMASLCTAWTVRDVVAHLTVTTRVSVPRVLRGAVRARGVFDRLAVALAAERAAAVSTAELVDQLRESAGHERRIIGSGPMDPLMDLVVHGQDIARPLGRAYVSPPDVVAACLADVATNTSWAGRDDSRGSVSSRPTPGGPWARAPTCAGPTSLACWCQPGDVRFSTRSTGRGSQWWPSACREQGRARRQGSRSRAVALGAIRASAAARPRSAGDVVGRRRHGTERGGAGA